MTRRVNVNGDFAIWQLGTTFDPVAHAVITADCWRIQTTVPASLKVEFSTDVPSFADAGRHIGQSYKITCLSTATPAANQVGGLVYSGEGYQWRELHGQPTSISCMVKSAVGGKYHGGLRTGAAPYKTCCASYTLEANVWTPVEMNLPAAPLTGGWSFEDGIGFAMYFFLGGGADFVGTPGVWEDGALGLGSGQVNWFGTSGATFQIAGVQLERGTAATPFEYQSFGQTLHDCQRYIEKSFSLWQPPASNLGITNGAHLFHAPRAHAGSGSWQAPDLIRFATPKRVNDYVVDFYNPEAAGSDIRDWTGGVNLSGTSADAKTEFGFRVSGQGGDLGNTLGVGWVANASVPWA